MIFMNNLIFFTLFLFLKVVMSLCQIFFSIIFHMNLNLALHCEQMSSGRLSNTGSICGAVFSDVCGAC